MEFDGEHMEISQSSIAFLHKNNTKEFFAMDKKKYCYSLRIMIEADRYSDERINNIIKYSKKYGFDDVMFFTKWITKS